MRLLRLILAVLLLLAAAGCGDDGGVGDDGGGGDQGGDVDAGDDTGSDDGIEDVGGTVDPAELTGRLPADDWAAFIDLATVRRDLGLDPEDDLSDLDDDDARRALFAAGAVLTHLRLPGADGAVQQALDTGRVQAAASVPISFGPDRAIAVVATTQPADEVLEAFADQGWEPATEGVLTDEDALVAAEGYTAVGVGDDGLVFLGQDADVVAEVVATPAGEPDGAAVLLEEIDGPARTAYLGDPGACGGALAASERFDGTGGDLVVFGDGELALAEGDRFLPRRGVIDSGPFVVESLDLTDTSLRLTWARTEPVDSTLLTVPLDAVPGSLGWLLDC